MGRAVGGLGWEGPGRGKHQCRAQLCECAWWGTEQGGPGADPGVVLKEARHQRRGPALFHAPWRPQGGCSRENFPKKSRTLLISLCGPSPNKGPLLHCHIYPSWWLSETKLHCHFQYKVIHFPTDPSYTQVSHSSCHSWSLSQGRDQRLPAGSCAHGLVLTNIETGQGLPSQQLPWAQRASLSL